MGKYDTTMRFTVGYLVTSVLHEIRGLSTLGLLLNAKY